MWPNLLRQLHLLLDTIKKEKKKRKSKTRFVYGKRSDMERTEIFQVKRTKKQKKQKTNLRDISIHFDSYLGLKRISFVLFDYQSPSPT